jgi:DNA-binding NarL/FixJ family response regulator
MLWLIILLLAHHLHEVISGFLNEEVLREVVAAGVKSVITKPVEVKRLVAAMQDVLREDDGGYER